MTEEEHQKHDRDTEQKIIQAVEKHGWFVAMFEAEEDEPGFAYTIGLWKNFKHPEIILFGLQPTTAHEILNTAGNIVKRGGELPLFSRYDQLFETGNAMLLPVLSEKELRAYLGYALWYNKGVFPAFQIMWDDTSNRFPWEEGFEEKFRFYQPIIGQIPQK